VRPAKRGFFPLDRQLELWEQHWSEQVAKQAVWLSGLVTYEQAEEILGMIGQVVMSDNSIWRRSKAWGERFKAIESSERAKSMAMPTRDELVPAQEQPFQDMGAAMDGAKVLIREEGWKELKVGCVFEIELGPTPDKHTGEVVDLPHAVNTSYVAHLGGPELFGQQVWAEARRRNWLLAHETEVLGDGAPWIWNLAEEYFYDSRQVVDWYHATEHLMSAAHALKGEGTTEAVRWFKQQETPLLEGLAEQIAAWLHQAALDSPNAAGDLHREADYFQTNCRRMQYMEAREEGFAIGSGMVESGCKQFRGRFNGPGMQWSRNGLEHLLPVRAAIMSKRFDAMWQIAYNSPPN
jgi:hypothetical protein